jgi:hypothetical protein
MNWSFIFSVGTMLFFAGLHQWSRDWRQWRTVEVEKTRPDSRTIARRRR